MRSLQYYGLPLNIPPALRRATEGGGIVLRKGATEDRRIVLRNLATEGGGIVLRKGATEDRGIVLRGIGQQRVEEYY